MEFVMYPSGFTDYERRRLFYAMGGSVSAGKSNDELIDHLVDAEFIRSSSVQRVFRAVDRGDYYHQDHKQNAYKDIAWRMGNLHLSAPCVYSVVMEALKLKPGLSFLNLGSGSGYLSTMAGLSLGQYGINHGIEFHEDIVDYAYEKLDHFFKTSKAVDEFDFCEPIFTCGNCLTLDSNVQQYDRVYCGAACPAEYESYVKNLVKVNGILVMPLNDKLLKITRVNETTWNTVKVLSVSFAALILPPVTKKGDVVVHTKLGDITPPNLQQLCRFHIRVMLRQNVDFEHPKLKLNHNKNESRPRRQVRRIVVPFFDESDFSNSQSESDFEYDSDSPEYTISSTMPTHMSVFLEDFLRRHAELQLLRQMEDEQPSSNSDSEDTSSRQNGVAENGRDLGIITKTAEQIASESEFFSLITVSNMKQSLSSNESDANFNQPPSQSTRSKKKNLLKRKHPASNSSTKIDQQQRPSTSSTNSTPEVKRKIRRAATVVWKKVDDVKKEKEKKKVEETNEYSYTHFLTQKISALPLPPFLLQYLNYQRNNL